MLAYPKTLLLRCWRMFIAVTKVMLPVMVLVQIGQEIGLVDLVGRLITPAMALLNLPPEAGIVWAATVFTGIYGGIASLSGLSSSMDLNAAQVSALCAMMLFAHAIPVEQAIVRRAGASFNVTSTLRIATAILYGAAISWFCYLTDTLTEPMSFDWLRGSSFIATEGGSGWMAWAQATAFSLALTFAVIVVLVLLLDILDKLGITRRITNAMLPLLKLSGLDARVAPVTTVGVLLGLTYGGALIIEEAKKQNFSRRTRFLALSWMSLSHGLIEDTLLVLALGADIWVVLVGRLLLTLGIIALLARLTRRDHTPSGTTITQSGAGRSVS
ncbi:nucleoside recognition domain-containing protein [Pollutimonas harenae]|uniref:nucleoside recognition domain-containing protein n=1 Tax=Pollutimonas harenae TaxID=657015 RepID=UPI001FD64C16|nr:nucleoside recognition domain-containing protein [Pollutimonas harenae]